jgi:predicted nuclease of restriction endonuclease-like RecB superfamily
MLTADLADVRRKNGELFVRTLNACERAKLRELATQYLDVAHAHVGCQREELYAAWDSIDHDAEQPRRAAALRKLMDDECVFEAEQSIDPVLVRRAVFTLASECRNAPERTTPLDRQHILEAAAHALGITTNAAERALFADLRGEHLLVAAPLSNADSMVDHYELAQAQAILLRAVRVTCDVRAASPGLLRAFFAKLKFHKLLFFAERTSPCGYRLVVDGPFSMFDSVTRYGVRFALLLPALRALNDWSLTADVRWGKTREALTFRLSSKSSQASIGQADVLANAANFDSESGGDSVHLADDVRALLDDLRAANSPFSAEPAMAMLDVPGLGVCIPDLVLRDRRGGAPVHVEVLGFWSRDAVFRRIELAQRGLGARIVFAVSARLRVSAELLDDTSLSALYVYKGKMNARALLAHAERIAAAGTT